MAASEILGQVSLLECFWIHGKNHHPDMTTCELFEVLIWRKPQSSWRSATWVDLVSRICELDSLSAALRLVVGLESDATAFEDFVINGLGFRVVKLPGMRKGLRALRRLHLALAAIFARVAGFGKNVVAFFRLGGGNRRLAVHAQFGV